MSNDEVAKKLFISQETVKSHVRHILAKLEADTRTQAVAIALREAIIDVAATRRPPPLRRLPAWHPPARLARAGRSRRVDHRPRAGARRARAGPRLRAGAASELLQQACGLDRLVATSAGWPTPPTATACSAGRRRATAWSAPTRRCCSRTMADGVPAAVPPRRRDDAPSAPRGARPRGAADAGRPRARRRHRPRHAVRTRRASWSACSSSSAGARRPRRRRPSPPTELAQLRVLADFAARAAQNARLYAQPRAPAHEAEEPRARARPALQPARRGRAGRAPPAGACCCTTARSRRSRAPR